jgi:hypothetical protein
MPLEPDEIKHSILQDYLNSGSRIHYEEKINQAKTLLRDEPEIVKLIDEKLKAFEHEYGGELYLLETYYYADRNLNAFYYPRRQSGSSVRRTRIKNKELKRGLGRLKAEVDILVIENFSEGHL